jgi:hypothetical protein
MKPGIHCARTHWIRGFMAFQLGRRTRMVMLMVPVCPEFGFLGRAAGRVLASLGCGTDGAVTYASDER